jgi:hypothetical protein
VSTSPSNNPTAAPSTAEPTAKTKIRGEAASSQPTRAPSSISPNPSYENETYTPTINPTTSPNNDSSLPHDNHHHHHHHHYHNLTLAPTGDNTNSTTTDEADGLLEVTLEKAMERSAFLLFACLHKLVSAYHTHAVRMEVLHVFLILFDRSKMFPDAPAVVISSIEPFVAQNGKTVCPHAHAHSHDRSLALPVSLYFFSLTRSRSRVTYCFTRNSC